MNLKSTLKLIAAGAKVGRINSAWSRPVRAFQRLSALARVAVGISVAALTTIGCGWFGPSESVRFAGGYGTDGERSYQRLPPLSMKDEERKIIRDTSDYVDQDERAQREAEELSMLWAKANGHGATREELQQAREELRAFLRETDAERDYYWPHTAADAQKQRNTAFDLLDALGALDEGTPPEIVHAYLTARRAYDGWRAAASDKPDLNYYQPPSAEEEARRQAELEAGRASTNDEPGRALHAIPRDKNLDDNVAYLRAARLYGEGELEGAAKSFTALAVAYPRSEKREAASYMAALSLLKQSKSYQRDDATALSTPPCADCRDEAWMQARALFSRVAREYPRGRFRADARGWLAFSSLRVGDVADALANYYRLASDDANPRGRAEALKSLAMARGRADDDAIRRLEDDLSDEPTVALTYAYHNLYNYAVNLGVYDFPLPADEAESGGSQTYQYDPQREHENEKKRGQLAATERQKEFRRTGQFAARMLRRYPNAATTADFLLRAAAANLETGEHRAAHELAVRALGRGAKDTAREDAQWIKGVAEYRQREYDAARRTLHNLVGENATGRLTKQARILLALIAEDAGDMGGALEQYLLLDYQEDAAYFIDVLMSPEQLAAYVTSHPQSAHLDELNYALGVRYLRAGRYAEARAAYARVRTSRHEDAAWQYSYKANCNRYEYGYNSEDATCDSPKMAAYDGEPGIRERWVLRDLKTAETLEWYGRAVEAAQGDEAKAEALYQMASYLYEDDLLFYNPAAWGGSRYMNLAYLDSSHSYRLPNEAQTLWRYSQSHDMAARALDIYLEVVRRFPETRAARDALYTAAMCHERLSEYNDYWRTAYHNGLHAGARMVTLKDVRAAYPNYRFPRGTNGWEPSTRTVNGGPGWDAPPKPAPRLTRNERVKRLLLAWQPLVVNYLADLSQFWKDWLSWLRYWLTVLVLVVATAVAGRAAAGARLGLRRELARRTPPPALPTPAPSGSTEAAPWRTIEQATLGWMEQMRERLKPQAVALYRRFGRRFEPLLHDAPGRDALVKTALSHTILFVLLFQLLRAI